MKQGWWTRFLQAGEGVIEVLSVPYDNKGGIVEHVLTDGGRDLARAPEDLPEQAVVREVDGHEIDRLRQLAGQAS